MPPLIALDQEIRFPPVEMADEDGLLAIGGDLSRERLLHAYRNGIFPWYENKYILWWCPDPRFVLFPRELKISSSMKQLLKKNSFEFSINSDFNAVISQCKVHFPSRTGRHLDNRRNAQCLQRPAFCRICA